MRLSGCKIKEKWTCHTQESWEMNQLTHSQKKTDMTHHAPGPEPPCPGSGTDPITSVWTTGKKSPITQLSPSTPICPDHGTPQTHRTSTGQASRATHPDRRIPHETSSHLRLRQKHCLQPSHRHGMYQQTSTQRTNTPPQQVRRTSDMGHNHQHKHPCQETFTIHGNHRTMINLTYYHRRR